MRALPLLERKLLRELRQIAGQAAAIVIVVACAVATAVMSFGVLRSLDAARAQYYERCRFGDLFASLPRAPESAAEAIRRLPGVAGLQTRLVADVAVGLAGTEEPIVARLLSLPERGEPEVNAIVLRRGRFLGADDAPEVIVSESFADAHGLVPGARLSVLVGGRSREMVIVGVALSPEYVYALGPGMIAPDDRRFAIMPPVSARRRETRAAVSAPRPIPASTTASITAKTSEVPSMKRSRNRKPTTSSASIAPPARKVAPRIRPLPGEAVNRRAGLGCSDSIVLETCRAMMAAARLQAAPAKPLPRRPSEGMSASSAASAPATAPSVLMP